MEGGGRSSILKGMQRSPVFSWILLAICFSSILAIQSIHGPSQEGFISIDCGYSDGPSYEEPETKLTFFPDTPYVAAGESKRVSTEGISRQYRTVRRFPKGDRNCYKLWPVQSGKKYMIRAEFWFYHYSDGDSYVNFDLHLGISFWKSVKLDLYGKLMTDVITVASGSFIWVCLINTGKGTPFISSLELRPLADFMYPIANISQSLVYGLRRNYGGESVRYPDDQYDRIWGKGFVLANVSKINSSREVSAKAEDQFQVPPAVMSTAFLGAFNDLIDGLGEDAVYIALHFTELQKMNSTEDRRRMNIELGGYLVSQNYSPPIGEVEHKEFLIPINQFLPSVRTNVSSSSPRPPLLNAIEAYYLRRMKLPLTDEGDAYAIHQIKRLFNVTRNWQGDPCLPKNYVWEGVGCKYYEGLPPRIIYLNMSSRQLGGEIPPSIVNMTALIFLDFSNNDFTGIVPHFLAELPSLQLVDLTGNSHVLQIPHKLCKSSSRIKGNVQCDHDSIKMKIIIASASLCFIIIVLITTFTIWRAKWRKLTQISDSTFKPQVVSSEKHTQDQNNIQSRFYKFTHLEIEIMTRNFSKQIGKGRFGTVYLGYMNDDIKVAIKILSSSPFCNAKEFQIEALLVARVHHQNLVSLIGYSDEDEENLALVYEYMEGGSISDILSGERDNSFTLSWEKRLNIALDTAQGLDYLHNGCSPSIIHRDLKSPKILLNKDFDAKISDFGQPSALNINSFSHMSNSIYDSAGYQDPACNKNNYLGKNSDVYCFGIILLELISGQKPFMSSSKSTHIVEWVHQCFERANIMDIVDPKLKDSYNPTSLIKALEISKLCTLASSTDRLNMGNVVMMIKQCLQ